VRRLDTAFGWGRLDGLTRKGDASSRRTPKAEAGLSTGLDRTKEAMNEL
jgi:hypothetical protein